MKKIKKIVDMADEKGIRFALKAVFWHFFIRYYLAYLTTIGHKKLKTLLSERKENYSAEYCKTCGICCKRSNCPNYNHQTNLCDIWNNADYLCKAYPLIKQQWEFRENKDQCRFYWE